MTTLKFLLAGLIATGLLIMPAGAHEIATAKRHDVMRGIASSDNWIYGNDRIPAPRAFSSPPHDEPGGVCDFGDNPMIC
jgi:hypothetical protein